MRHNPSNPTPPALPANILPRGLARHGSGASSTHRLLNGPESPPWARLSRGGAINKCLRTPRPPPAFRGCNGSPQSTLTAFDKIPQEGRDWVNVFSEPRRGIFLGRPANPLSSHRIPTEGFSNKTPQRAVKAGSHSTPSQARGPDG